VRVVHAENESSGVPDSVSIVANQPFSVKCHKECRGLHSDDRVEGHVHKSGIRGQVRSDSTELVESVEPEDQVMPREIFLVLRVNSYSS